MACNGHNHRPDCNCGWGGIYYLSDCLPSNAKTFSTPCPWRCGSSVFYHTNGYGDSVFFDELGTPWPIHECFKKYWEEKKKRKLEDINTCFSERYLQSKDIRSCFPHSIRGKDLHIDLDLNHKEACFGGRKMIRIPSRLIICNECLGNGFIFTGSLDQETCLYCDGDGRISRKK